MGRWIQLLRVEDCPPGTQRYVSAGGQELAVFRLADSREWAVIHNSCPHAGGNLSAGTVAGGVLSCPWHQWEFNLHTGACVHNEQVRVRRYAVRVREGWLEAEVDEPPA
jgi:nitrite reductase/ring-hydroxylating ferredoxin subunit